MGQGWVGSGYAKRLVRRILLYFVKKRVVLEVEIRGCSLYMYVAFW